MRPSPAKAFPGEPDQPRLHHRPAAPEAGEAIPRREQPPRGDSATDAAAAERLAPHPAGASGQSNGRDHAMQILSAPRRRRRSHPAQARLEILLVAHPPFVMALSDFPKNGSAESRYSEPLAGPSTESGLSSKAAASAGA